MKSTLNKTNDVNGTIVIELEKVDYQEKVEQSLNQFRQRANIPGFRQGKVPKKTVRKSRFNRGNKQNSYRRGEQFHPR